MTRMSPSTACDSEPINTPSIKARIAWDVARGGISTHVPSTWKSRVVQLCVELCVSTPDEHAAEHRVDLSCHLCDPSNDCRVLIPLETTADTKAAEIIRSSRYLQIRVRDLCTLFFHRNESHQWVISYWRAPILESIGIPGGRYELNHATISTDMH